MFFEKSLYKVGDFLFYFSVIVSSGNSSSTQVSHDHRSFWTQIKQLREEAWKSQDFSSTVQYSSSTVLLTTSGRV